MEVWFRRFCWISIFVNFPAVNFQGCMSIFLSVFSRRFFHPTASTHPTPRGRTNRTNWIVWPKSCPTKKKWHNWNWRNSVFQPSNWQEKMAHWNDNTEIGGQVGGQNFYLTNWDVIKFFLVVIPVWIQFLFWMVPKAQTRPYFNRFKGMKLLRSFYTSAFPGWCKYDDFMVFSLRIMALSDVDFSNLWKVFNMPHLGRLKSQVQNM